MANTYSQLYVHLVFVVRMRAGSIHPVWESELFKYMTGIIQQKEQKLLAINGMPDHVHILIGIRPTCCLSDLVKEIKKSSTGFIQKKKFCAQPFHWQKGFGAFTCGHKDVHTVALYIENQKRHHAANSLKAEYHDFLASNAVDFKEEFLFDWTDQ